jgi:uncharacterized membrane protein YvbJ
MKTCPKCRQPHEGKQTYCPQCWRVYDAAHKRVNRRLNHIDCPTITQAEEIIRTFGDGQYKS